MTGERIALSLALLTCLAIGPSPGQETSPQEKLPAVEIIAHRGASDLAPENTLASVNLAWELGADAVEVDIHQTRDGRIVVMHDATTKKTTGIDWKIAERTLAELRTLDAGSSKSPQYAGEKVPTLAEVLATIPEGKRLFIEIKCPVTVVPELVRVMKQSGKSADQMAIIAFDLETSLETKRRMPPVPVYWLAGTSPSYDKKKDKRVPAPRELLVTAKLGNLDGIDIKFDSQLTADVVCEIHGQGLGVYVWTVNAPEDAIRLAKIGVDGITTDRPRWLRAQIENATD